MRKPRKRNLTLGLLFLSATAPLLLAQSPSERPWPEKMAEFEEADRQAPPQPGGVVFVGSSSIRKWDLPRWFPDLSGPVLNRGFGGSEIEHSIAEAPLLVLRHKPRAIVLYAGDNDIDNGKSAERVAADFADFVRTVRAELPETMLFYIAIKPSTARWDHADEMREANRAIQSRCEADPTLRFVDIWTPMLGADGKPREALLADDGLHLTDAGYELWSGIVREALETQWLD